MRSMVEGDRRTGRPMRKPLFVIATRCHLPVPGRNHFLVKYSPRSFAILAGSTPSSSFR